jgi:ATP-dependent DNA helicase PIF1
LALNEEADSTEETEMAGTGSGEIVLTDEFRTALSLLEQGESIFLTGKAGTGKSTLIREFLSRTSRNAVVAAPTGIAALNVDGYTIHRLFSFTPTVTVEHVRSEDYYPRKFGRVLSKIDTLIVDEASMVRADIFDCMATALERFGPRPGERFGGVQIVLVGDLFQLPPVVTEPEKHYFSEVYDSPFFFSARKYERHRFPVVELTTVFRQVGDSQLVDILNSVRDGSLDDADREVLNQRVDPAFEPPLDEFWLTLTTTNRIATARNKAMLDQLPTEEVTSCAEISGDLDGFENPTDKELMFKVGAQIMLLTNDSANRWVNGSIGKILEISTDGKDPSAVVQLNDGKTVQVDRQVWQVTRPVVQGGRLEHEVVGSFTQLPFRLAWAITIHKSQGQTLDRCRVDLAGGTFADGQLYVALSRCTSLNGLVLSRAVEPKHLRVNQRIRRFLDTGGRLTSSRGGVYLGVTFVGDVGRQWKPRVIELAVVTDDGHEATTLVAPGRDVGDSRQKYGITATDVQLAPTLPQAWNALAPLLEGRTPVGVRVDETLEYIDFELKRGEMVTHIPVGDDVAELLSVEASETFDSLPALEKARTVRELAMRSETASSSDVFAPAKPAAGYLLGRGHTGKDFQVRCPPSKNATAVLAELLSQRPQLASSGGPETLEILRKLQKDSGVTLVTTEHSGAGNGGISEVLQPGTRICFTGTATDGQGGKIDRDDLKALASSRGLEPVDTVTKTKCDVLVVAERGTQSGKARQAEKFQKLIFTVEEFTDWLEGNVASPGTPADSATRFTVERLPATDMEHQNLVQGTSGSFNGDSPESRPLEPAHATSPEAGPKATTSSEQVTSQTPTPSVENNTWDSGPLTVSYATADLGELLRPGSRITFAGIITSSRTGDRLTRPELAALVEPKGLIVEAAVTKTRTDVLIDAGASPDSVQIRTAIKYDKPIILVDDFFAWLEHAEPASHRQQVVPDAVPDQQEAPLTPPSPVTLPTPGANAAPSVDPSPTPFPHHHRQPSPSEYTPAPVQPQSDEPLRSAARGPQRTGRRFHLKMLGLLLVLMIVLPFVGALIAVTIPATDTVMAVLVTVSLLAGVLLVPVWIVLAIKRAKKRRRQRSQISTPDFSEWRQTD